MRRRLRLGLTLDRLAARFRTIQARPKDLRALPVHPEPAVSWHSGFRGGAHARPKATPVPHAARWRYGRVAARGARAASGARAPDRDSDAVPADKCGSAGARARLSGGAAKTWMGRRGQRPVRRALDR